MKKIITVLGISIAAAILMWLFLHQQIAPVTKPTLNITQAQTNIPLSTKQAEVATPSNTEKIVTLPTPTSDYVKSFNDEVQKDPNFEWKHSINFWGRVVDEGNNSIADAGVHFVWNDLSPNGTSEADTKSDGNGFFSLLNRTGKHLLVSVGKDGYYSSRDSQNTAFEYANPYQGLFTPDQNNPVVFHLRKKGEGESLIQEHKLFGFKPDGTVYYLDLLTGKKFTEKPAEWDLIVQFTRSEANANGNISWTAKIGTSGGGLAQTDEEFMFLAPESGYEPMTFSEQADDLNWKNSLSYRFYFQSRSGKIYGRIEGEIIPKYNQDAAIDMNYSVNPSGSRNLESR